MSTSQPNPPRFLALVGPTAVGKTVLSLRLAGALDAEVVSVDSRQVYRGMDIGTAKVAWEERQRVPHHGLDLVDPDERYSAGRFARDARRWIAQIEGRGRTPLLVGGSGFFLKALMEPVFREPWMDPARRVRLRRYLGTLPAERLRRWMARLDPDRLATTEPGGSQRLSRALEVALLSGRPLSWWHEHAPPEQPPTPGMVVLVEIPRKELYRRVNLRAEAMLDAGLEEEVRALRSAGYGPDDPGMTGTGYREVWAWIEGKIGREEALDRMRRATRRYARRQLTWFRNQLPEGVLEVDGTEELEAVVERITSEWVRQATPRARQG